MLDANLIKDFNLGSLLRTGDKKVQTVTATGGEASAVVGQQSNPGPTQMAGRDIINNYQENFSPSDFYKSLSAREILCVQFTQKAQWFIDNIDRNQLPLKDAKLFLDSCFGKVAAGMTSPQQVKALYAIQCEALEVLKNYIATKDKGVFINSWCEFAERLNKILG